MTAEEALGGIRHFRHPDKLRQEQIPLFLKLRNFNGYKGNCGRCEYVNVCGDYLAQEPFCAYQPRR